MTLLKLKICVSDGPVLCNNAGQEFATVAHNIIITIEFHVIALAGV